MQIDYELTQRDFIDSFAAHRSRNLFSRWLIRLFISFSVILAAVLIFGLIVKPSARDAKADIPFFGLTFLWIGILRIFPRWNARKQFLKQPGAQGPREVRMDDTGVHWRWDGGSSDILWKNYVRAVEGKNQFLLYTSPACFNIIPKRALSAEGSMELRALLKRRIDNS